MPRPRPGITVLVVDDDDAFRDALALLIETFRVHVRTARDGVEALDLIAADPPDLILCDLRMPRLDGFALVRALRADRRLQSIHVVAITGLSLPADVTAAREAGFDGHVVKPITAEMIDRILDRVRAAENQGHQQG